MDPRYIYKPEEYNRQMNEVVQAGVKGMSERSELIPCNIYSYSAKCRSVSINCATRMLVLGLWKGAS